MLYAEFMITYSKSLHIFLMKLLKICIHSTLCIKYHLLFLEKKKKVSECILTTVVIVPFRYFSEQMKKLKQLNFNFINWVPQEYIIEDSEVSIYSYKTHICSIMFYMLYVFP